MVTKRKNKSKGKKKGKSGYHKYDVDLKLKTPAFNFKPSGFMSRKPNVPIYYKHVSEETINLHATKLMPKTEKLAFIDPKAVEVFPKATPRLKVIVEHLGSNLPKKPIDPRVFMGIGILVIFVVMGIVIFNSQVIAPADAKEKEFELRLIENAGNQTAINEILQQYKEAKGASGGGLFDFKVMNPLQPPPVR